MALQIPSAQGRYLTSHSSTISTKTLSSILSKRFPQYKFPAGEDTPVKTVIDNSKVCFTCVPQPSVLQQPCSAALTVHVLMLCLDTGGSNMLSMVWIYHNGLKAAGRVAEARDQTLSMRVCAGSKGAWH